MHRFNSPITLAFHFFFVFAFYSLFQPGFIVAHFYSFEACGCLVPLLFLLDGLAFFFGKGGEFFLTRSQLRESLGRIRVSLERL
jgi:hypothetical protein